MLKARDVPCMSMFNSAVWKKGSHDDLSNCKKCVLIEIMYLDKYYEEISEIKDFGFEDLISGAGGFIGIFLGYSMMQIPQLMGMSNFGNFILIRI